MLSTVMPNLSDLDSVRQSDFACKFIGCWTVYTIAHKGHEAVFYQGEGRWRVGVRTETGERHLPTPPDESAPEVLRQIRSMQIPLACQSVFQDCHAVSFLQLNTDTIAAVYWEDSEYVSMRFLYREGLHSVSQSTLLDYKAHGVLTGTGVSASN